MIDEIVVIEWLFDHEQVKLIQPFEMILICDRVSRVGINGKHDLWMPATHLAHNVNVPAGFDLQFDSLITVRQVLFNAVQELRDSRLYAETDADRDASARAADHS